MPCLLKTTELGLEDPLPLGGGAAGIDCFFKEFSARSPHRQTFILFLLFSEILVVGRRRKSLSHFREMVRLRSREG